MLTIVLLVATLIVMFLLGIHYILCGPEDPRTDYGDYVILLILLLIATIVSAILNM